LPLAAEMGTGVIVMEPPGAGMLGRRLKAEPGLSPLRAYGVDTWAQALPAWVYRRRSSVVVPVTSKPTRAFENAHVGPLSLLPSEMSDYLSAEIKRCR
jgi:diketogulonate reductase-like aldo/keto reductase